MSHDGRRRLERQSKAIAKQQAQDGALAFGLSIGGQSLPPTAAIGGAMEHYGLSCERPSIDTPVAGPVNRPGFVDSDDGANVRSAPAEMGGLVLTPIPPAARVFVSGRHPATPEWWYVTTIAQGEIVRGYVQRFRLAVDAPEPAAKLYQIQSGDTAERLASREFGAAVRDGLDLRFYEHVLLHVNRQQGRAGVRGTEGDVQLDAGRRIWLVSPEYALSLAGSVASGSLTGGLAAKARRGAGHLGDVLESVTSSPRHVRSVAGEVADALLEHLPEIVGITAGFIVAECASAFLAATPTGVGQLAAVMIQLGLAAFGANAAVEAGDQAMTHAEQWLTLAWTANGDRRLLDEASREFVRMLVSIAFAAMALSGTKGNWGKAVQIAERIVPPGMGALAFAGAGSVPASAIASSATGGGPSFGGVVGVASGDAMAKSGKGRRRSSGDDSGRRRGGERYVGDELAKRRQQNIDRATKAAEEQLSEEHLFTTQEEAKKIAEALGLDEAETAAFLEERAEWEEASNAEPVPFNDEQLDNATALALELLRSGKRREPNPVQTDVRVTRFHMRLEQAIKTLDREAMWAAADEIIEQAQATQKMGPYARQYIALYKLLEMMPEVDEWIHSIPSRRLADIFSALTEPYVLKEALYGTTGQLSSLVLSILKSQGFKPTR